VSGTKKFINGFSSPLLLSLLVSAQFGAEQAKTTKESAAWVGRRRGKGPVGCRFLAREVTRNKAAPKIGKAAR